MPTLICVGVRWRDVADDNEALERARAEGKAVPGEQATPGVCFRTVDDSAIGRWRVAVEDAEVPAEARTWAVWDLRRRRVPGRDDPRAVLAVKVDGGYKSRDRAIAAASLVIRSRVLRSVLAGWRAASTVAQAAARVPAVVREEWAQR